jgi:hypothetical protein
MADPLHLRRAAAQAIELAFALQRLGAGVHRLACHGKRRERRHAREHVDLVAIGLPEADAFAAAGLVDLLHRRRTRQFRKPPQIVLIGGMPGEADEGGLAFLRHMDVAGRTGAAHIERGGRALGPHHAEMRQELFHDVEIRRAQPAVSDVRHLDHRHSSLPACSWTKA